MKYNVYEIEKIINYKQPESADIEYDYEVDFLICVKAQGVTITDFIVTDSELNIEKIYYNGTLFKVLKKVAEFNSEQVHAVVY